MRDHTRKRLDHLIWLQRARIAGGILAACLLIAAGFWLENLETTVENKKVS
jgi:hypothetical protein